MIPISKPLLGDEEIAAVSEALRSGWVTQGPRVEAFERAFAAYVDAPHACAVSSGTAALYMALRAVGVRAGDEVITVSYSYIATANAIRMLDARPVFVDIDATSPNIDPSLLESASSDLTRAVLCVHQMGAPCDLATVAAFCRDRGVPLIEDAACAAGSEILIDDEWQKIGRPVGDIACFSFHPRKVLTTGDGGMLTTRSKELDDKLRVFRNQGRSVSSAAPEYHELGFNFRLTDIQAAMGIRQLERLDGLVARRRGLVDNYRELLAAVSTVEAFESPPWAKSNWQSFWVDLAATCDQGAVIASMRDDGVATLPGIMCAHREPLYRNALETWRAVSEGGPSRTLPRSELAQDTSLLLPLYHQLSADEQQQVVEALARACR